VRTSALAADASETLTYTVQVTIQAEVSPRKLINTAEVTSSTPDPDPSDNEDKDETERTPPVPGIPEPELGPPPAPEPEPDPPAPPLVVTGVETPLFATLAAALLAAGGVFLVGARRAEDDD